MSVPAAKTQDRRKLYIVIAGAGMMGAKLAGRLVEDHQVVVIDKDFRLCESVAYRTGAVTVEGNATSMNTLNEAGIRKADVACGMMSNDADNLAFALLARHFGVSRIVVRMRDEQFEAPYRLAGATRVVDTIDIVLSQIVIQIQVPEVRDAIPLGKHGEMFAFRVSIPENARVAGKSVAEIDRQHGLSRRCTVVAAIDALDRVTPARGDTVFSAGGEVLFVARTENLSELTTLFTQPGR